MVNDDDPSADGEEECTSHQSRSAGLWVKGGENMFIKSFLRIMFYDPDKGWVEEDYDENTKEKTQLNEVKKSEPVAPL